MGSLIKKLYVPFLSLALFVVPFVTFARERNDLQEVFTNLGEVVAVLTPVIVAVALLGFFWGLAMYVLNFGGDDKDKKKGRDMMVYGILVLFVMVSVWGLVQVLQNTFLSSDPENEERDVPCVKIPGVTKGDC